MTVFVSNTVLEDNLDTWRLNTNLAATVISNNVVTISNSQANRGGYSVGNGHVEGTFSASNLRTILLSGGNTTVSTPIEINSNAEFTASLLTIGANTVFTGNVNMSTITGTNRLFLPDASRIRMTGGTTGQYIKMNEDQFTFSFIQFSDFDELQSNSLPLILSGINQSYEFEGSSNTTPPIQFETGTGDTAYIYLEDTNTFEQTQLVFKMADSGGLSDIEYRNSANAVTHKFGSDGSVVFNENQGAVPFVVKGENKIVMVVDGNQEDVLMNGMLYANGGIDIRGTSTMIGGLQIDSIDTSNAETVLLTATGNTSLVDVSLSGNVTSDLTVEQNANVVGTLLVGGDTTVSGNVDLNSSVTLATDDTDTVSILGNTVISSTIYPSVDDTYDLGSPDNEWRNLYIDGRAEIDELAVSASNGTGVASSLTPKTNVQYNLGSAARKWNNLHVNSGYIYGSALINGSLEVDVNADITGDTSIGGNLSVSGNETVTGNQNVGGNSTVAGDHSVTGNQDITGTSTVSSDASVGGNLSVAGNESVTGNHSVTGDSSISGNMSVSGKATVTNNIEVATNIKGSANLEIDGDFGLGGDIVVIGDARFDGNLTLGGNLNDEIVVKAPVANSYIFDLKAGHVDIAGNTTLGNASTDYVWIRGKVRETTTFEGNTVFQSGIEMRGNTQFTEASDVEFHGNTQFVSNAIFQDDVQINGNLGVDGNIVVGGQIQLGNEATDIITTEGKFANAYIQDLSARDVIIGQNLTVNGEIANGVIDGALFTNNVVMTSDVDFQGIIDRQQTVGIAQFNKIWSSTGTTKINAMTNGQFKNQFHSNSMFTSNTLFTGTAVFNGAMQINGELQLPSNVVVTQANGVFTNLMDSRGDTILGTTTANTLYVNALVGTDFVPTGTNRNIGENSDTNEWGHVYANSFNVSGEIVFNDRGINSHRIISSDGYLHANTTLKDGSIEYSKMEKFHSPINARDYGTESRIPIVTINREGAITNITTEEVNAIASFEYNDNASFTIMGKDNSIYTAAITDNTIPSSVLTTFDDLIVGQQGNSTSIPVITVNKKGQVETLTTETPATVDTMEYNSSLDRLRINTHDGERTDVTLSQASETVRGVASFQSDDFDVTGGHVSLANTGTGAVTVIEGTTRETNVSRLNGRVTVGLTDTVNISDNLYVGANVEIGGHLDVGGNAVISGNLTVSGETVTIDATELSVEDPSITLSVGTQVPTLDAGIIIDRGIEANVELRWNEGSEKWQFTNDGTNYNDMIRAEDVPTITYVPSLSAIQDGVRFNLAEFIDESLNQYLTIEYMEGDNITLARNDTDTMTISAQDTITNVSDGEDAFNGNVVFQGDGGTTVTLDPVEKTVTIGTDIDDFVTGAVLQNDVLTLSREGQNIQVDLSPVIPDIHEALGIGDKSERNIGLAGYGTDTPNRALKFYRNEYNEEVFSADATIYEFNSAGLPRDFKIRSDGNENMFFIDSDLNRIGIGKNNPSTALDIDGTVTATNLRGSINYGQIVDPPSIITSLDIRDQDESVLVISGTDTWTITGSNGLESVATAPGGSDKTLTIQADLDGSMQIGSLGLGVEASGLEGDLRTTGDITAFYSSDRNLKENIKPIENALDKVKSINGVTYDWKDEYLEKKGGEDDTFNRKNDVGVIAQEIEAVLPEIVAERNDGTKAVKYERIVALLIEAVKDLSAEVDELKKNK